MVRVSCTILSDVIRNIQGFNYQSLTKLTLINLISKIFDQISKVYENSTKGSRSMLDFNGIRSD